MADVSEKQRSADMIDGKLIDGSDLLSFLVPFAIALALEQWATSQSSCSTTSFLCQMCIVKKTALAATCGCVGLLLSKKYRKKQINSFDECEENE